MVDIKGLDKARVLLALYRNARAQGLGLISAASARPLTVEDCRGLLEKGTYFDYLLGRVMKVSIEGDSIDPRLYDRDNGQGAAQRAIDEEFPKDDGQRD